jgi:excisionase family DNA binding protein
MPEYLTTKQVAQILAVNVGKVADWLADGSLVGVNVTRNSSSIRPRWRISREALDKFIQSRQGGDHASQR